MNNKGLFGGVIVLIIVAVFVFGIAIGFSFNNESIIPEVICENVDQPMLLVEFLEWGEYEDMPHTAGFYYNVLNFGNTEIKNVKVKCEISDVNEVLIKEQIFNIGNVASNSYEWQESTMDYSGNSFEELGVCYLDSADGEYINLIDRLDDLE